MQMPNNAKALVSNIGIMKVSPLLTLYHVLCVLSFNFNLVSMSALTKNDKYCLIFTDEYCIVQEQSSWTMIGLAKATSGLYHLQNQLDAHSFKNIRLE